MQHNFHLGVEQASQRVIPSEGLSRDSHTDEADTPHIELQVDQKLWPEFWVCNLSSEGGVAQ
jgi:hypothetical protein